METAYKCILLFGAPGTGKGTQGKRLGEMQGFLHLATGDIFRSLDRNTDLGREFLRFSTQGELVPDDITMEVWKTHVKGMIAGGTYDPDSDILLLDGMPRSVPQAQIIRTLIEPLAIIHLVATDEDEMVRRMKLRAETQNRPDDADEKVIRNRFGVYHAETEPVLNEFDRDLIIEIDAVGTIDEVFERVRTVVKPIYEANFVKA